MENTSVVIQQEIAQLEQRIKEKQSLLEQAGTNSEAVPEKELLHEAVGEQIQQQIPSYAPKTSSGSVASVTDDTPSYLLPELKDAVQDLVNLAFSKSISEAVQSVEKSNNGALIDAFHDV